MESVIPNKWLSPLKMIQRVDKALIEEADLKIKHNGYSSILIDHFGVICFDMNKCTPNTLRTVAALMEAE